MQPNTPEVWKSIPGYEGLYEVSDQGRVRSLDREFRYSDGRVGYRKGKILKPVLITNGRHQVYLHDSGSRVVWLVHRLVLLSFVGPCPEGMEACHYNDDFTDNRLANLRWDTRSSNVEDRKRNGIPFAHEKSHCPSGHEYSVENTYVNPNTGGKLCKTCQREHDKRRYARRRDAGHFREAGARYRSKRKK